MLDSYSFIVFKYGRAHLLRWINEFSTHQLPLKRSGVQKQSNGIVLQASIFSKLPFNSPAEQMKPILKGETYKAWTLTSSGCPTLHWCMPTVLYIRTSKVNEVLQVQYCTVWKEDHILYYPLRQIVCSRKEL